MSKIRAFTIVGALLISGILVSLDVAALDSGSWTNEIPGVADSVSRLTSDGGGDKVGFSYRLDAAGTVGFTLFNAGTATIQTGDISGNSTPLGWTRLAYGDGATWHILAEFDATTAWWFKSTDDGVTWALLGTFAGIVARTSDIDALGNLVVLAAATTEATPQIRFYKSTAGGLPGGSGYSLTDNRGSPSVAGDQFAPFDAADIAIKSASEMALIWANQAQGQLFEVRSVDGGAFWTIPYTAEGGSTQRRLHTLSGSGHDQMGYPALAVNSQKYVAFWIPTGGTAGSGYFVWDNAAGGPISIVTVQTGAAAQRSQGDYRVPFTINNAGAALITRAQCDSGDCTFGTNTNYGRYKTFHNPTATTNNYNIINDFSTPQLGVSEGNVVIAGTLTDNYAVTAVGNPNVGYRLEVSWQEVPPQFGAELAASVAVTGLVGFDVDLTGSTVIARHNDNNVSTFAGGTLTQSATTVDTFCNRVEGVAAWQTHVAFLVCDPLTSVVLGISIRSSSMGPPTFSEICDDGNFCFASLSSEDLEGNDNDRIGIGAIQAFPFDFSKCSRTGEDHCNSAWAYSDTNGNLGVLTYTWRNNAPDRSNQVRQNIDPTASSAVVFCATRDDDGKNYLYAANQNSNPKGFRVDFTEQTLANNLAGAELIPKMTQVWPGTSSTAGAIGIGCGEGRFAVGTPTEVTIWERGAGSPSFTKSGLTGVKTGGVVMSDNGDWVAYAAADGTHLICANPAGCFNTATNSTVALGTETFSINYPDAGNFQGIKMDGGASNYWLATSTIIARYSISSATTGEEVAYDPATQPGATTTATGTAGTVGVASEFFPNANPVTVMVLGTIATVAAVALLGWRVTRRG